MMSDVTTRRWGVVRWSAVAIATALVLAGCGQARHAAPPIPEFTSGHQASPTVVALESGGGGEVVLPADVEPDLDSEPGDPSDDTLDGSVDVSRMLIVDDAGNASPDLGGWARFDAAIDRRLGANQAFGVAVMVDGQLVHEAAFGDRLPGGDEVATTDRFRIASISKTVTAIVVMQMVDDGVLDLDAPIGELLADHLGVTDPDPDVASITVRRLLSHTAGFPKHESTFFGNGALSCSDAAVVGLSAGVASGSAYRYSNMGYCVLGVLIEAVTGKTYERVVAERLLAPLGIAGMRITSTYEVGPDEVAHATNPGRNFMETLGAAGSWNATPADLVRILNSIDHRTSGWKSVSAESAQAMRLGPAGTPQGYGLGLLNYGSDGWGHTGTIQNTHAMVLRQSDGLTWAITVAGTYPSESSSLRSIALQALAEAFGE